MVKIKNVSHVVVYKDPSRACNQVSVTKLRNGEILAAFNEERGMFHADDGWASLIRSKDGGKTWDPTTKTTILGCTESVSNWDPAITQLSDGILIVALCQRHHAPLRIAYSDSMAGCGINSLRKAWLRYIRSSTL